MSSVSRKKENEKPYFCNTGPHHRRVRDIRLRLLPAAGGCHQPGLRSRPAGEIYHSGIIALAAVAAVNLLVILAVELSRRDDRKKKKK